MAKKMISWKTKGMNRDLSVSAFNPEFAFENMNLRLSTNEGNTLMSWVNEKGTKQVGLCTWETKDASTPTSVTLAGYPIGTAVINHQLIIFTTANTNSSSSSANDYVYLLEYSNNKEYLGVKELYTGNLNFCTKNPLETLVSYEAENIQKVYWTDGRNQPRMINIKGDIKTNVDTQFDFIPAIDNEGKIEVIKNSNGGFFAPGVIQYCFSYINKYGQQSNVVDVSPLYYATQNDRGANAEETVNCSFTNIIVDPDTNFEYVRIYSIQSTSINSTRIVKLLEDIPTGSAIAGTGEYSGHTIIKYLDTGNVGSTIDPYALLFVGGKEITALTMTEKDKTLFLGNLEIKKSGILNIQDYFDYNRSLEDSVENKIKISYLNTQKSITGDPLVGIYTNNFGLNKNYSQITTFKGGEHYRFGFQLQKYTGEWTDPIFIDDAENTLYPTTTLAGNVPTIKLVSAQCTIPVEVSVDPYHYNISDYRKIRPIIVYPDVVNRQVLCQGVINPTVFNAVDRIDNSPYAQASWFFRPYVVLDELDDHGSITVVSIDSIADTDIEVPSFIGNDHIDRWIVEITSSVETELVLIDSDVDAIIDMGEDEYTLLYIQDAYNPASLVPYRVKGIIKKAPGDYFFIIDTPVSTITPSRYFNFSNVQHLIVKGGLETQAHYNGNYSGSFQLYSGIHFCTKENRYDVYYTAPDEGPSIYEFDFAVESDAYRINFRNIKFYDPSSANKEGNTLYFVHGKPLYKKYTYGEGGTPNPEERKFEIQGTCRIATESYYDKTASTFKNTGNNFFYIDQSIQTLNSPDIDFDTEVQNYSTEDLKMRIVGVIPISSSASAHSISIKSSMSPLYYVNNGNTIPTSTFGSGDTGKQIIHKGNDVYGGRRTISEYLWNDTAYHNNEGNDNPTNEAGSFNWMIYPWHRSGSLTNDWRGNDAAVSLLDIKKMSTLLYSGYTIYDSSIEDFEDVNAQIYLTENNIITNIKMASRIDAPQGINYYPNVDKVLYNNQDGEYRVISENNVYYKSNWPNVHTPISMKYKSTSHMVVSFKEKEVSEGGQTVKKIPIPPYYESNFGDIGKGVLGPDNNEHLLAFWQTSGQCAKYIQNSISDEDINTSAHDFLFLAEIYKDVVNPFGGQTKNAVVNNTWLIGGEEVDIPSSGNVTINWTYGDTYYQRYDCLKTYPFTKEDPNQVVEILSFMCETHVNIDGRYDRNRGQIDNTNMNPQNFNLLNPIYNQKDNVFSYKKTDTLSQNTFKYPNHITYSLPKESGADVDNWTNVTLATTLELDGDKGSLNSLHKLNDSIIAFQDSGISQILYNENVAISSTSGVPIELANSGKVQGNKYISNSVGCSNKWSIADTPMGIYFMDSYNKSIWLFNGDLNNISSKFGFNTWCKNNISASTVLWTPDGFDNFVTYYDRINQDVLFVSKNTCLAYSEQFGYFTSFYDYEDTPYFCNYDDIGLWVGKDSTIWKHRGSDKYCEFFGTKKPYWMTLIGNPEPQTDKIFTNLEFRACVEGDGAYDGNTDKFTPTLPFDSLETWDEYQHGYTTLENKNGHDAMIHGGNSSALKRKFRMWRCDIPRDNVPVPSVSGAGYETDENLGITRKYKPLDRMRNPWLYLKLKKGVPTGDIPKVEIHDLVMTYFN